MYLRKAGNQNYLKNRYVSPIFSGRGLAIVYEKTGYMYFRKAGNQNRLKNRFVSPLFSACDLCELLK